MKNRKIFFVVATAFFIKLVFAYLLPIFADEAYYYVWSLKPQLSYYDHPGMVSWLINLNRQLVPFFNPLNIRLLFVVTSTLTTLVWIKILIKSHFTEQNILFFLILTFLNPLLGLGSVVATPDVPLVLFWSLSYLFYLNIIEPTEGTKPSTQILNYSLLGVFLGLGFCSKYHIVLFLIGGLADLIINKKFKNLLLFGVMTTIFWGFVFSLPVLLWNQQNDWASFAFQFKHGFGKSYYDWRWTLNFFIGQALLISPLIFFCLFKKNNRSSDKIFTLSQIVFFTFSSFKAIVEANWPITSQNHAISYFVKNLNIKYLKITLVYWLIVYSGLVLFFFSEHSEKILRNQYRTSQMSELLPLVKKYKPLYGSSYQIAALLSWQTQQFIPKLNGLSRFDFYDTLPESTPNEKKIYVLKHFDSIWPDKYMAYSKTLIESFDKMQIELYQLSYE